MALFCVFLHPQKHIRLHISKNIARNPAELWDIKNRRVPNTRLLLSLVGAKGFEPSTPWSQTKYSTRLSYTPLNDTYYNNIFFKCNYLYHIFILSVFIKFSMI